MQSLIHDTADAMEHLKITGRANLNSRESSTESLDELRLKSKLDESDGDSSVGFEDIWEEWDPMKEIYASVNNLNSKDIQHAVHGLTNFKGTLCPHAIKSGPGGCYKGSKCPFEHHVDQTKVAANPKMGVPKELSSVVHFACLPSKPLGPSDSVFIGTFSYIASPQEFYVIPKYSITCFCSETFKTGAKTIDPLAAVCNDLRKFYSIHDFRNEISFAMLQLVVVRCRAEVKDHKYQYYRAVVVDEDVVIESDDVPDVKCFLLDVGTTVRVALSEVAKLPYLFCKDAPRVYKCSLYGISPMYRRYTTAVQDRFLELLTGNEAIVKIHRPYYPVQDRISYIEPTPYGVSLLVKPKSKNNSTFHNFIDVKDELIKTNQVIAWNLNIFRPFPWNGVMHGEVDMILNKKIDGSFNGKFDSKLEEEERIILKKLLSEINKEIVKDSIQGSPSPAVSSSSSSFVTAPGTDSDV